MNILITERGSRLKTDVCIFFTDHSLGQAEKYLILHKDQLMVFEV